MSLLVAWYKKVFWRGGVVKIKQFLYSGLCHPQCRRNDLKCPTNNIFWMKQELGQVRIFQPIKSTFFGTVFVIFGRLGVYLPPVTPSTTTPCPGIPPPPANVGAPSSS
jgi:hypothetical protein